MKTKNDVFASADVLSAGRTETSTQMSDSKDSANQRQSFKQSARDSDFVCTFDEVNGVVTSKSIKAMRKKGVNLN